MVLVRLRQWNLAGSRAAAPRLPLPPERQKTPSGALSSRYTGVRPCAAFLAPKATASPRVQGAEKPVKLQGRVQSRLGKTQVHCTGSKGLFQAGETVLYSEGRRDSLSFSTSSFLQFHHK